MSVSIALCVVAVAAMVTSLWTKTTEHCFGLWLLATFAIISAANVG